MSFQASWWDWRGDGEGRRHLPFSPRSSASLTPRAVFFFKTFYFEMVFDSQKS